MYYIILCNILYNTNHFLAMPKTKIMLVTTKKDNYKSLHLDNFDKKYLVYNNKDTKMPTTKYIIPISNFFISEYTTFT